MDTSQVQTIKWWGQNSKLEMTFSLVFASEKSISFFLWERQFMLYVLVSSEIPNPSKTHIHSSCLFMQYRWHRFDYVYRIIMSSEIFLRIDGHILKRDIFDFNSEVSRDNNPLITCSLLKQLSNLYLCICFYLHHCYMIYIITKISLFKNRFCRF